MQINQNQNKFNLFKLGHGFNTKPKIFDADKHSGTSYCNLR